jgi:uncharacterized protein YgiM (DUF1202 family)
MNQAAQQTTSSVDVNTEITASPTPEATESQDLEPTVSPKPTTYPQVSKKIKIIDTETGYLNVRAEPDTTSLILEKVISNEEYEYTEEKDDWYKILLKSGNEGWVSGSYVDLI